MPRFLAWGNNLAGNISPSSTQRQDVTQPRDITDDISVEDILWTGWSCSVGLTTSGIRTWGTSSLLGANVSIKDFPVGPVKRILGFDDPVCYLDTEGYVRDFGEQDRKSASRWDDVSVSGTGAVYAYRRGPGLYLFDTLEGHIVDVTRRHISHPALNPSHPARVYSMESRAFVHTLGPMHQLFEILTERRGKPCDPELVVIEGLEGMELAIIPGPCNRLGVLTDAGSAFVLDTRSQDIEPIDISGDTRLLGLGSRFEVVVVGDEVLTRGRAERGQLGRLCHGQCDLPQVYKIDDSGKPAPHELAAAEEFAAIELPIDGRIIAVHCSRWATILTVDDAS